MPTASSRPIRRRPRRRSPRVDTPRPPDPPKPPGFDHTKHTFVTAVLEGADGKRHVWIDVRTTGKQYQLREGEKFEIGGKRGVVRQIGRDDVELEIDGQRRRVTPGLSLAEGKALDAAPSGKPAASAAGGGPAAPTALAAESKPPAGGAATPTTLTAEGKPPGAAAQPARPADPFRSPFGRSPSGPFDPSRRSRYGSR